jgi:hypothetical protein
MSRWSDRPLRAVQAVWLNRFLRIDPLTPVPENQDLNQRLPGIVYWKGRLEEWAGFIPFPAMLKY